VVIPSVSPGEIAEALMIFDRKHRNSPEFTGWEHKGTQRYAIVDAGKLYPPKMIISLAAGIRRSEFSGGHQSNSYLTKRGFEVIDLWKDDVKAATRASLADRAREVAGDGMVGYDQAGEALNGDRACLKTTLELYSFQIKRPRFNYLTAVRDLPRNGIYFFFEKGERVDQGVERIVRVGTHTADERFRGRIRQHYGSRSALRGNKNASVFRKHVGGALLRRDNPRDERLKEWLKQGGRTFPDIETRVSEILRDNFTFCCFSVEEQEVRLRFERGIIALLAKHPLGRPSAGWLGQYAYDEKIGRSGLWNTQQLDAEPLNEEQVDDLKRFV
jgi:hypothetical protein